MACSPNSIPSHIEWWNVKLMIPETFCENVFDVIASHFDYYLDYET